MLITELHHTDMTVICNSRVILQTNDAITGVNDPILH